jgi:hypothetical protein
MILYKYRELDENLTEFPTKATLQILNDNLIWSANPKSVNVL